MLLIKSFSVITYLAYRVLRKSRVAQYVKLSRCRYRYNIYSIERIPDVDAVRTPSTAEMQTSTIVTKTLKAWARITVLFRINSDMYKHIRYCMPVEKYGRVRRTKNSCKNLRAWKIRYYFDVHCDESASSETSISYVINANCKREGTNENYIQNYLRERTLNPSKPSLVFNVFWFRYRVYASHRRSCHNRVAITTIRRFNNLANWLGVRPINWTQWQ